MDIIRTQIYLRKKQHRQLREEAHRLGVSLTELLRRAWDDFFERSRSIHGRERQGLSALIGLGQTDVSDGALRHDDYVADAIAKDRMKPPPRPSNPA